MEVRSISMVSNCCAKTNFSGKFVATQDAKKLINSICPADELIKDISNLCQSNSADFMIKLETGTQKELDKMVTGFKLSALKKGEKPENTSFLYAKNSEDLKYLYYSIGQIFQKLAN